MVLNPNYTDGNDWEIISAGSAAEQLEEDLIVDGYKDDSREEEELQRQLLPSSSEAAYTDNPSMVATEDEELPEELQPLTSSNEDAVQEIANDSNAASESNGANREAPTSVSDLKDTVVVSKEREIAEELSKKVAEDANSLHNNSMAQGTPKQPEESSASSNFEPNDNGDAAPPHPKGAPKLVASLGASVKNLGEAIGKEGQKFGKAIEEETKRIGKATQQAFQPKPPRKPSPSDHTRRPRPEHTSLSPPRERTRTKVGQEESSLLANVLSGAAVLAGGILLARGNKGAGAALLATGGATYMANEATKESRKQNIGLNEVLGAQMN